MKINESALKHLIKSKGMTVESFGDKLGMKRQNVYHLMLRKYIKQPVVDKISMILSVDKKEFLEPDVINKNMTHETVAEPSSPYSKGNIIFVPLHAQGGFLNGYANKVYTDQLECFFLPGITGEHFAFEIAGMSMYKPGDERSAKTGDIIISKLIDGPEYFIRNKGYILQTIDGILYKVFDKITKEDGNFISLADGYDHHKIHLKKIKRAYFVDFIIKKPY